MNPFTIHTQQQGISYVEHMVFAMGIAHRLLRSVIAFTLHAVFPFLDIKVNVDLKSTAAFIEERNDWIESKKVNEGRDLLAHSNNKWGQRAPTVGSLGHSS